VVQGDHSLLGGLDGVACLFQETADVADALVDRLWSDAEQGRDGDLGQAEAVVEEGGQESVGEGENGAAPGAAVALDAWSVAPAFVQVRFPLVLVEGRQRGDQGVPVRGWQSGQGRVTQPGKVGTRWSNGSGSALTWAYASGRRV
jgi:hypothetical protein